LEQFATPAQRIGRDDELAGGAGERDEAAQVELGVRDRDLHDRRGADHRPLEDEVALDRLAGDPQFDALGLHAQLLRRGTRVEVDRQACGERHARDAEADVAAEAAEGSRRRDRQVRRDVRDLQEPAADRQRAVLDRESRRRPVAGERDVAGELLAEDVEAQPGAGKPQVLSRRRGRRRDEQLEVGRADVQDLADGGTGGVELQPQRAGEADARDRDGDRAGQVGGDPGAGEQHEAYAAGERDDRLAARGQRERDVRRADPDDGGRARAAGDRARRPLEGEVAAEGLPEEGRGDADRLDAQERPCG